MTKMKMAATRTMALHPQVRISTSMGFSRLSVTPATAARQPFLGRAGAAGEEWAGGMMILLWRPGY